MSDNIDYRGARGSNAGDQFHELWALLHVLELLKPDTPLRAVGVEGVKSEAASDDGGAAWDGVDVTLYYGAPSLERADQVEFAQLKYSSANPDSPWTTARLTQNSAKKGNNSVVRKLANAFRSGKAKMKAGAKLTVRLVSNQPISDELSAALRPDGPASAELPQSVKTNRLKLRSATGLAAPDFAEFVACLDISECGSGSRFALQENVIAVVAEHLGDDVSSVAREIQMQVRNLMLPERASEVVTQKDLLLWFGFSSRDGLFPCEPDIRLPSKAIKRSAADTVLAHLAEGKRVVLVHGVGGCGKTTLMRQIEDGLPPGSVSVNFDCYGGGRYMYSDDKRHLPEKAFLQLTNEVALALQLPLFIPRDLRHPADVGLFLGKLKTAGLALEQLNPKALLAIIIDAADNSVTGAEAAKPPERSFVHELAGANLGDLPSNVRFVFSARSSRKETLRLPADAQEDECPLFDLAETKQHLETVVSRPSDTYVEQFHTLSHQNPRVQSYAISATVSDRDKLLDVLRPGGKTLPDVLRLTFDSALRKLGQAEIFDRLLAALAFLPAPANIGAIARVAGSTDAIVRDWASDLTPGLRVHDGSITIADEDFEKYIRETASKDRDPTVQAMADDFIAHFAMDPYASLYVADALVDAARAHELLDVIERDPQITAISDPVQRRQVQVRRLSLALAACRHAGTVIDALKTILISAEAQKDESTLIDVLEKEMDLSVEFGGASLRRLILLDRERVAEHGTFLAHDAARASRANDRNTTREQLHFYDAWLRQRRNVPDDESKVWSVADRDVAARIEAILNLAGADAAFNDLMRWSPRDVSLRVANILVPQLAASGKTEALRTLIDNNRIPAPWDLVVLNALAMAGEPVEAENVERSLQRLRKLFIPDPERFATSFGEDSWQKNLLDTFVTACELAYRLNVDDAIILAALNRILEVMEGKARKLYSFDFHRLDALFRCNLLCAKLRNENTNVDEFIGYLKSLEPPPPPLPPEEKRKKNKKKTRRTSSIDDREDRRTATRSRELWPIYAARIEILSASRGGATISASLLDAVGSFSRNAWEFDRDHDSIYLRAVAARAVMNLLIIPELTAADLQTRATNILHGRHGDWLALRRTRLWEQMRLRYRESDALIRLVAAAAKEVREARASASDKLDVAIRLSRLVLPVSRDDADALFNEAISIAKEIDQEAIDQIEFFATAAASATLADKSERRSIAVSLFTFITAASERLSGRDFNWEAGVNALAAIDLPSALAAVSRWADTGMAKLDESLEALLPFAIDRGQLTPRQGIALSRLLECAHEKTTNSIAKKAASEPEFETDVLEELSKQALLFASQAMRLKLGEGILANASPTGVQGAWGKRLRQAVEFGETLKTKEPLEPGIRGRKTENAPFQGDDPRQFVFEPEGPFRSVAEIQRVLSAAHNSDRRYSDRAILQKMMAASSDVRHRVAFLNAVAALDDETVWSDDKARIIAAALEQWGGTPAIERWCRDQLPSVLVDQFHGFTRWMKQGQVTLLEMFRLAGLDPQGRLDVILAGVAKSGSALGSRALFGIAELISQNVEPYELGPLLTWYASRLLDRIPPSERETLPLEAVPLEKEEAIGRLVFALMSDIDTRIRWRAAHCLRVLSRLQCQDSVSATMAQRERQNDEAFREPSAPFYHLAAKMWLALATYRIASETPSAISPFKTELLGIAISSQFPHVAIREYAKRTLEKLASSGSVELNAAEKSQLATVNCPAKGKTRRQRKGGVSFHNTRDDARRFKFNTMDTLRYWYEDILRIFPTVSSEEVLKIAERWIVDEWGADSETNWWDKEPRKARYDERRYGLWSNDHGSPPVVERYGTHLEWHAMHCAIGQLLQSHPITQGDIYYERFDYWLTRALPSNPPAWLSDHRGPTPLERRLWIEDPRSDKGWLYNAGREDALAEMCLTESLRPGWLVVDGYYTAHFPKRETNVRVSTALISPPTALPLVRALQTAKDPYDFRIPNESDDGEIRKPPYQLVGWIAHKEGDTGFDDRDPARYEVGRVHSGPGKVLIKAFGLERLSGDEAIWICKRSGESALIYEAWCDEPTPDEEYYPRRIRSDGWRLWARSDIVQSFLQKKKMDLICEIQIDRRLRSEHSRSYDPDAKKKLHDKILLFRADGFIEDANRRLGAWAHNRSRAGSGTERRHARPVDVASHSGADRGSRSGAKRKGKARSGA